MNDPAPTSPEIRGHAAPDTVRPSGRLSLRRGLMVASVLVPLAGVTIAIGAALAQTGAQTRAQTAAQTGVQPRPQAVQPAAQPVTAPASQSTAIAVLLERANFWRNQTQYEQALEALNRAQALEPTNPDVLALIGQIQADRGNRAAAETALAQLRRAAPGDPRIDKIDQSIKVGPIPVEALADARRLAREGRVAEAVDRYNRVFRGNPPPDALAVEYYQTLSGSEGGWEKARDGLAATVRANPQDLRSQLAYAQLLTYRDGARTDGINRLAALAQNPAVSDSAVQAWRQALTWLPQDKSSIEPLQAYLTVHPNDGDIAQRLELSRNPPPDPNDPAANQRIGAFDLLNKGRLTEAASAFQAAIDANPNDADSTGGLGVVRLRQRRFDDARALLTRAMSMDPLNKGRWQQALNGVAAAIAGSQPNPANAMIERGDFAAAEAEIQRQVSRGGDAGQYAQLADVQARQGKTQAAEASYRTALQRNPRYAPALVGLAGILGGQGRHDESIALLQQAESVGGDRRLVGQARALQLREQALGITDPGTQAGLFRAAISADPANPWLRLDYARALVKQGDVNGARTVMAEVVSGKPSTEALRAGILFANETSDPDAATTLFARLPPNARTADLRTLQAQAELQREIGRLLDLPRSTARARLLQLAAVPDPDGARGSAIARSLAAIGDPAAARRAIVVARDATPNQGRGARVAYAGALLDIGDATGAQVMLAPLGNGAGLTADQRQAFTQLRAGLAIKTADDLNQAGKQAEAYDRLAPALAADPDNPEMNLALARLYSGARNPREALDINEALLRRDPNNADARRGAVAAALAAGDRARAEALVKEGLDIAPDDPRSWMASADLARARGNNARALRDLARARELRLQQLGYSDNGTDDTTLANVTLAPESAPIAVRGTPSVRTAPIGSGLPASTAVLTYGNPDRGQDVPPLAVPPGYGARPTPLSQSSGQAAPVVTQPLADPAPVAAQPLPAQNRLLDTQPSTLPPYRPASAQPAPYQPAPYQPAPYQPAPYQPAPYQPAQSGPVSPADALNAQQLGAATAAYPSYPAPTYSQAPYPSLAAPQSNRPQYAQPQGTVSAGDPSASYLPQYRPQPVPQPAPAPGAFYGQGAPPGPQPTAQIPAELRYQPQVQGYLPQYQPAPPPTAAERMASDEAQFLRDTDFNKPFRPLLPRTVGADAQGPYGTATQPAGPVGFYDNPFRRSPDSALALAQAYRPTGNGFGTTTLGQRSPAPDPITQEIDRNIVHLRDSLAPTFQGGFGFRSRSGDAGLDKLSEIRAPIEGTFSPGGNGTVKLSMTPVVLDGGTIGGDDTNLQRFGTLALGLTPPVQTGTTYVPAYYTGTRPSSQTAQGLALAAGYTNQLLNLDIGTSPIGFRMPNIQGGAEITPQLSESVRLRVGVERRSLTDSVLSYAGTFDPRTGLKWGGVVRSRGKLAVEFTSGPANFYIDGGAGTVTGRHVAGNNEVDFGAGGSYPVFKQGNDEIRVGVDLVYFAYKKNLRFFTLGQGGYFSPQTFISGLVPITFTSKVDEDLTYEVGGALGLQSFSEKASNYYPADTALQSQLNAVTTFSGLTKVYPARSQSGFAGNFHGKLDYRVSPGLHLGASLSYQHSGDFDEAIGMVYARYIFNGTPR